MFHAPIVPRTLVARGNFPALQSRMECRHEILGLVEDELEEYQNIGRAFGGASTLIQLR